MQATQVLAQKPRVLAAAAILTVVGASAALTADFALSQPEHALATRAAHKFQDKAEHVIYLGGIVLERNRHAVVGGTIGCALGATIGAGAATAIGLFTAGTGLALVPAASALGCGLGAIGGTALGYPLDDYLAFGD